MDPAESADAASTFTTSTVHRTSSLLTTANPNGQLAPRPHVFIRTYRWLHSFSQATRCLIFICPFLLLMTLPVVIELVWFPGVSLGSVRIHYWAIYLMVCWTALFGSRVVISYIPNAIQWVLGVMTISVKRYMDYVRHTEKYLGHVLTALIAFVSFPAIMVLNNNNNGNPVPWQSTVQSLLLALLILVGCIAGEKLFLQIVAVRFHERTFHDRIEESSFSVFVISKLDHATKGKLLDRTNTAGNADLGMGDLEEGKPTLLRPATKILRKNLAKLVNHTRNAFEVTTNTLGYIASEIVGKDLSGKDGSFAAVNTASEARQLGRRVFKTICPATRNHLLLEDFVPVFQNTVEAQKAFWIFDRDGNGDISLDEFVIACSHTFRERKAIMQSLRDLDQAIGKLDSILKAMIYLIITLIIVAIFMADFTTYIATAGSLILALSFMIGSTAQTVFESIIFVFVRHPFDVGDRVEIEGVSYIVKEMHLLATTFVLEDGREVYAPNNLLAEGMIDNIRRSGPMSERILVEVSFDTNLETIEQLRERLVKFLESESREFFPQLEIFIKDIKECNLLILEIEISHKTNMQDDGRRMMRRNKFMCVLKDAIEDLCITYRPQVKRYQRLPDVNTNSRSSSPSFSNRRKTDSSRFSSGLVRPVGSPSIHLDGTFGARSDYETEDMEEEEEERRRKTLSTVGEKEHDERLEAGLGTAPSGPLLVTVEEIELEEVE